MSEPFENILVIKSRHIGDVLLTGPLFSTLRLRHPQARLTALVKSGTEAMLTHHPHVDEVLTFPKREKDESKFAWLRRQVAWNKALRDRGFDLAINTTEGDRGTIAAWLSGAERRVGIYNPNKGKAWRKKFLTDPFRPPDGLRHTVQRNLDMAFFEEGPFDRTVRMGFSPEDEESARKKLMAAGWDGIAPLAHVHPTSRWLFKCWTDAGMTAVIDALHRKHGFGVVVTSSPDVREMEKAEAILKACQTHPLDLTGKLSLTELAAVSAQTGLFFGVDTAPMHMAAALGVPVVVLFGPSGAFEWGPWPNGYDGEESPYPGRKGVRRNGPHTVIQQIRDCVPCGEDGCDGSKRSECLDQMPLGEVLSNIEATLARAGEGA